MNLRAVVNWIFAITGFRFIAKENYDVLRMDPRYRAGKRWAKSSAPEDLKSYIFENLRYSNSQIQQDLFASWVVKTAYSNMQLDFSSNRYFVEFGATNGFRLSNTFFLEMYGSWEGLLCEPARVWQEELRKLRKCSVDFRCVYSSSGESLSFTEAKDPELGTLTQFRGVDSHSSSRLTGENYLVETVSLNDLLDFHQAPRFIDYLSIDTEGSEFEILKFLDFEKYSFGVITVEHNFTPNRKLIYNLLTNWGYVRVLTEVSEQDDWYISPRILRIFRP